MPIDEDAAQRAELVSRMSDIRMALTDDGPFGPKDAAVATFAPLGGHTNRVWLASASRHRVVVKLFAPDRLAKARREWAALGRLSRSGFAPARISYRECGHDAASALIVSEHIDGTSALDHHWQAGDLRALLNLFAGGGPTIDHRGEEFAAMAAESPSAMARQVASGLMQAAERDAPGANLAGAAAGRLELLGLKDVPMSPGPAIFCHGDPGLNNAIIRPDGRPVLVDWEDSGLSDSALEFAKALLHRANCRHAGAIRSIIEQCDPTHSADRGFVERSILFSRILIFALILRRVGEARRKLAIGQDGNAAADLRRGERLLASAN